MFLITNGDVGTTTTAILCWKWEEIGNAVATFRKKTGTPLTEVIVNEVLEASEYFGPKPIKDVVALISEMYEKANKQADLDAGFDAGEFSGPLIARAADKKAKEIAESHGYLMDEIDDYMMRMANEPHSNQ